MPVRVLIVEPFDIVRRGLELAVPAPDITLVAATANWTEAMRLLTYRRVNVLLVEPSEETQRIFQDMDQLKWVNPNVRILLYTHLENPAYFAKGVATGGKGLISKKAPIEVLQNAIRTVNKGESLWHSEDTKRCPPAMLAKLRFDTGLPLSDRERDVLTQIAMGNTNKAAATNLNISYETVKESVQQLLRKIDVEDRTQAALWAYEKGIFGHEQEEKEEQRDGRGEELRTQTESAKLGS